MVRRLGKKLVRPALLLTLGFLGTLVVVTSSARGQAPPPQGKPVWPAMATVAPDVHAKLFQPGAPWDGSAQHGRWSRDQLETFQDYPVYAFRDQVMGYNLQGADRLLSDTPYDRMRWGGRPRDEVTLIYGTCPSSEIDEGCYPPASVLIRPLCALRPEQFPTAPAGLGPRKLENGAIAQPLPDGAVIVWTNTVSIRISTIAQPGAAWDLIPSLVLMNSRSESFPTLAASDAVRPGRPRFEICN